MPDGRFVSKTIAHDLELNTVSLEADYLFGRCIPHLDVEGRMAGHPAQVKGIAVPLRDSLTIEVVERCLGELHAAGLVVWYEAEGRQYLAFPGFSTNQKGLRSDREAPSRIPAPETVGGEQLRTNSGPTPEDSGPTPAQVKVSQGKSSQEKRSEARARSFHDRLGDWLGEDYRGSVIGMDEYTAHSIYGLYCTEGDHKASDEGIWDGMPAERRPPLLSTAILRMDGEARGEYRGNFLRRILSDVVKDAKHPPPGSEAARHTDDQAEIEAARNLRTKAKELEAAEIRRIQEGGPTRMTITPKPAA